MDRARQFLIKVGVQSAITERMFSIDSQNATYLSWGEVNSLRMAPDFSELKLANCGPEPRQEDQSDAPDGYPPGGEFASLTAQERRWLKKGAEREICWQKAQDVLRQGAIREFLQTTAPLAASPPTVTNPDPKLDALISDQLKEQGNDALRAFHKCVVNQTKLGRLETTGVLGIFSPGEACWEVGNFLSEECMKRQNDEKKCFVVVMTTAMHAKWHYKSY
jgi:hypothetical protein